MQQGGDERGDATTYYYIHARTVQARIVTGGRPTKIYLLQTEELVACVFASSLFYRHTHVVAVLWRLVRMVRAA
eukprot:6378862-Pyramimonas_sp.AAC.1